MTTATAEKQEDFIVPIPNLDICVGLLATMLRAVSPICSRHQYTLEDRALWMMRYVLWTTGSPRTALFALLWEGHRLEVIPKRLEPISAFERERLQDFVFANHGLPTPTDEERAIVKRACFHAQLLEIEHYLIENKVNVPTEARKIVWEEIKDRIPESNFVEQFEVLYEAAGFAEEAHS